MFIEIISGMIPTQSFKIKVREHAQSEAISKQDKVDKPKKTKQNRNKSKTYLLGLLSQ